MTDRAIFNKCEKLLNSTKYEEVLKLLSSKTLLKHNNPSLYVLKAHTLQLLNRQEEAVQNYSKAIELNNKYFDAYVNRGVIYSQMNKNEEALKDFNKAVEINDKNPAPYINKAILYKKLKNNLAAEVNYEIAIKLNRKDPEAYYNRGLYHSESGNYKEAVKDFSKAIHLDNNFSDAYISRGSCYVNLKKYQEALADFDKAIKLNPKSSIAYYNKGVLYHELEDFQEALKNYDKAIKLDNSNFNAYNNRGLLYYKLNEYERALRDYNEAIKIKGSNVELLNYKIDIINSLLGKNIQKQNKSNKQSFYYFDDLINKLVITDSHKIKIKQQCAEIITDVVEQIRMFASECSDTAFAHYTKLKVADILTSQKESSLRYYNTIHMNDPEEGKLLIDYFDDEELKTSFENGKIGEENNIYIGSFLPASEHQDELIMWRTYGKDENKNDASGCSIIIDSKFFDKERSFLNTEIINRTLNNNIETLNQSSSQCLYKVIYLDLRNDNKNNEAIDSLIVKLKIGLHKLLDLKFDDMFERYIDKDLKEKELDLNVSKVIDKIIFQIISEVRYFFKSSDYSFENEYRVIQFVSSEKDAVIIDRNNNSLPCKLYINSNKSIQPYIKKIILGPKVPLPEQWIYLEAAMKKNNHEVEIINSNCKYQ